MYYLSSMISQMLARLFVLFRWKQHTVLSNARLFNLPNPKQVYPKLIRHIFRELLFVVRNKNFHTQHITPRALDALPELRKGGILLTAHFGNWEWMGPWLRSLDVPLMATYKPLRNPTMNRLMQFLRNRNGSYTFPLSNQPFALRTHFRKHRLFTILADQDFRENNPRLHPFFSHPAHCNPLPETLLRLFPDSPIFMARVFRNASHELTLDIFPLFPSSPTELYPLYHLHLEDWIRESPEQYIGLTHRRLLSTLHTVYSHT